MAIVHDNIVTKGFTGKLGDLVFRRRGNKTTVYVLSPRKTKLSKKQKEAQNRFANAVADARLALSDEAGRKQFKELAKHEGKESAYSAAVAYFMNKRKPEQPISNENV